MSPEQQRSLQVSGRLWAVLGSHNDTDDGVRNKAIGIFLEMNVLRATHFSVSDLLLLPGWKSQQPTARLQRICFLLKKLLVAKQ